MQNIPFSTLPAFEAAARHENLSKAAAELNLTSSAVSHQLKRLEMSLQVRLFERSGRGIALTDVGQVFAKSVRDSLSNILSTASSMKETDNPTGRLTIACPPMFASKWLSRHLLTFLNPHSAVECQINLLDNDRIPFEKDYDVGIGFGSSGHSERWCAFLRKISLSPAVSSRLYAQSSQMFQSPADLGHTILLHRDDGHEWRRWFASAGLEFPDSGQRHLYCRGVALDLVAEGVGVALVSDVLAIGSIHAGTLIRPFSHQIEANGHLYAICDRYQLERASVRAFLRWIFGCFDREIGFVDNQPVFRCGEN